jgi:hypothetical protein
VKKPPWCCICEEALDPKAYFVFKGTWAVHRKCIDLIELSEKSGLNKFLSFRSSKYYDKDSA